MPVVRSDAWLRSLLPAILIVSFARHARTQEVETESVPTETPPSATELAPAAPASAPPAPPPREACAARA